MSHLVSVVIPAYNATATIGATLESVRRQTWPDIEIIVIDDGSSDDTAAQVSRHAAADSRIRLVVQANGGVAAARNRGIADARGSLVAPLDADDLWHPNKLERQVAALRSAGPRAALVYCWSVVIDADGRIIAAGDRHDYCGDVFSRMCRGNLVGNGSAPLMRRQAVLAYGGYDSGLRAAGAEGCEDLKLYLALAERHDFAVVNDFLVGYRWTPQNMSSDGRRMLRSFDLVMEPVRARHPDLATDFARGRADMIAWLLERAARAGQATTTLALLKALIQERPARAARALLALPCWCINSGSLDRREAALPRFVDHITAQDAD